MSTEFQKRAHTRTPVITQTEAYLYFTESLLFSADEKARLIAVADRLLGRGYEAHIIPRISKTHIQ